MLCLQHRRSMSNQPTDLRSAKHCEALVARGAKLDAAEAQHGPACCATRTTNLSMQKPTLCTSADHPGHGNGHFPNLKTRLLNRSVVAPLVSCVDSSRRLVQLVRNYQLTRPYMQR